MTESSIVRSKSYDSFDLFKFITSLIIMLFHTNPLGESHFHTMHPWCRIAVPVFFMISSFLFFGKYDILSEEEKKGYMLKFVKRNLVLYIFWFIIFLPFTIIYRDYLHKGIIFFIGSIFLGSTFPASWFLIALAISIIIVAKLDKGGGKIIVPVVGILFYLLCLGQFTWRPLADRTVFLPKLYDATEIRFANTFFVSVIWVWIGRVFVKKKDQLLAVDIKKITAAFILSMVLLFIEDGWLFNNGYFTDHNDVYLMCLSAVPLFFWIILKLDVQITHAKTMRCMSTLIYCIHATIAECLKVYVITPRFGKYELPWSLVCFLVTAAVTLLLSRLILKFSDRFKILKYAF